MVDTGHHKCVHTHRMDRTTVNPNVTYELWVTITCQCSFIYVTNVPLESDDMDKGRLYMWEGHVGILCNFYSILLWPVSALNIKVTLRLLLLLNIWSQVRMSFQSLTCSYKNINVCICYLTKNTISLHNNYPDHYQRNTKYQVLAKTWRNWTLTHSWMKYQLLQTIWKTIWRSLKKLKIELCYDAAFPLLDTFRRNFKGSSTRAVWTHMHTVALFTKPVIGGNNPNGHQLMNRWRKCSIYIQQNVIQP